MMAPSTTVRLTPHPETSPASLIQLLKGILYPFWILALIFFYGTPRAIWDQLTSLNPFKILSPFAWRDAIWGHGSPPLLKISDTNYAAVRRQYLSQAYGKVLEVGAGSGELIKYYDESKVTQLFALEPFPALVKKLRQSITARGPGFEAKSTIVNHGIEDKTNLSKKFNLNSASIDTLVLVQCLCSIPDPKKHLREAVELLKPGGKLILIEHVSSPHPTTRLYQDILTPAWAFIANGCELNRDSVAAVKSLRCWTDIQVERPDNQTLADAMPYAFLQATKAKTK